MKFAVVKLFAPVDCMGYTHREEIAGGHGNHHPHNRAQSFSIHALAYPATMGLAASRDVD
jgi:hypothetical protein